jgi:hypothetical protein
LEDPVAHTVSGLDADDELWFFEYRPKRRDLCEMVATM